MTLRYAAVSRASGIINHHPYQSSSFWWRTSPAIFRGIAAARKLLPILHGKRNQLRANVEWMFQVAGRSRQG
jgi:hypothetical protein